MCLISDSSLSIRLCLGIVGLTHRDSSCDTCDDGVGQVIACLTLFRGWLELVHRRLEVCLDLVVDGSHSSPRGGIILCGVVRIRTQDDPEVLARCGGIVPLGEELYETVVGISSKPKGLAISILYRSLQTLLLRKIVLVAVDGCISLLDDGVVAVPGLIVDPFSFL